MIRAYVAASSELSAAMKRVAEELARWAPPAIEISPNPDTADVEVLHVIGYPETVAAIERLDNTRGRYAIMQYCLRSTQEPHTSKWLDIWRRALCVWSYYDLDAALHDDGLIDQMYEGMPFYLAPLGADPDTFQEMPTIGERYGILTSGYVAESECVAECFEAARLAQRRVFHLGPQQEMIEIAGPHVDFGFAISDAQLARAYSRSDYVAGMRRVEGFEMPAVEGLLCGARPIMLDRPHYRAWFNDHAEFVPEADAATLTKHIADLLRREPRPVTDDERAVVVERFNWQTLVGGFWDRVLRSFGGGHHEQHTEA